MQCRALGRNLGRGELYHVRVDMQRRVLAPSNARYAAAIASNPRGDKAPASRAPCQTSPTAQTPPASVRQASSPGLMATPSFAVGSCKDVHQVARPFTSCIDDMETMLTI